MEISGLEMMTAVGRTAVGALLLIAGIAKLRRGTHSFQEAVLAYDLLPKRLALNLGRWLPRGEVATGLLLCCGLVTKVGEAMAIAIICMASVAVALSLLRGRKHHCACIGFTKEQVQLVQWRIVYRNLLLLGILLSDWTWPHPLGLDRVFGASSASEFPAAGSMQLLIGLLVFLGATVLCHLTVQARNRKPRTFGRARNASPVA